MALMVFSGGEARAPLRASPLMESPLARKHHGEVGDAVDEVVRVEHGVPD